MVYAPVCMCACANERTVVARIGRSDAMGRRRDGVVATKGNKRILPVGVRATPAPAGSCYTQVVGISLSMYVDCCGDCMIVH